MHGGTPSRRDKHITPAAIRPPGFARGRFVGGQQSGLAGCKPPPLFTCGASSCSSHGRRQRGSKGRLSTTECTYLPTYTSSKQQERHKHSVEFTVKRCGSRDSLSLRTGSNPVPYNQCTEISHI